MAHESKMITLQLLGKGGLESGLRRGALGALAGLQYVEGFVSESESETPAEVHNGKVRCSFLRKSGILPPS